MDDLSPSTMLSFRAGRLCGPLRARAIGSAAGAVCRRDLGRYYWLLGVTLAAAPPVSDAALEQITGRLLVALDAPTADGDLTAALVAAHDLLPGWTLVQQFALADAAECLHRRTGGLTAPSLRAAAGLATAGPPKA